MDKESQLKHLRRRIESNRKKALDSAKNVRATMDDSSWTSKVVMFLGSTSCR